MNEAGGRFDSLSNTSAGGGPEAPAESSAAVVGCTQPVPPVPTRISIPRRGKCEVATPAITAARPALLSLRGHDDSNPAIERLEHRECNRAVPNRLKSSREW